MLHLQTLQRTEDANSNGKSSLRKTKQNLNVELLSDRRSIN